MALTTIGTSSEAAVQGSVAQALRGHRVDVRGRLFEVALLACLLLSLVILGVLIVTILTDGSPVYADRAWPFLDGILSGSAQRAGISQGIVGSFWIAVCVVVIAFPLGIGAAIYLEEYAPRNRLTSFIELNIRNLAGVPSVVYGLLGLAIFVDAFSGFAGASGVDRRTLAAAGRGGSCHARRPASARRWRRRWPTSGTWPPPATSPTPRRCPRPTCCAG